MVDLEASRRFYVETLGFVFAEETAGALYLRGYEEAVHHSLVLVRSTAPSLRCLAFRVRRGEDLRRVGEHVAVLGCPVRERAQGESPAVGQAIRARDPLGFTVEFFHEIEPA